ncbi:MAG: hypothetical protein CMM01_01300 [Rhodopirellula sp.]|nr:hypothetical protein [Rhodopirellula sp.]OUX52501.1 MAG: hypothetical protein CBE43_00540 [Rhodopirellula sp. TMED283]
MPVASLQRRLKTSLGRPRKVRPNRFRRTRKTGSLDHWTTGPATLKNCFRLTDGATHPGQRIDRTLKIPHDFRYSEIYPSNMLAHFFALRKSSWCAFKKMLFFDDKIRKPAELSLLGVCCVHLTPRTQSSKFQGSIPAIQTHC